MGKIMFCKLGMHRNKLLKFTHKKTNATESDYEVYIEISHECFDCGKVFTTRELRINDCLVQNERVCLIGVNLKNSTKLGIACNYAYGSLESEIDNIKASWSKYDKK